MIWLLILPITWLVLASVNDCYDLQIARHRLQIISRLTVTTFEAGLLYLVAFFVFGRPIFLSSMAEDVPNLTMVGLFSPPRIIPALFLLVTLPLIVAWRLSYIKVFTSQSMRHRVLIVGAGNSGQAVVTTLRRRLLDYKFIGFIDDNPSLQGSTVEGLAVLGNRYFLERIVEREQPSEIILAITNNIHDELLASLMRCYERGIPITPMSLLYEQVLGLIPVEHLGHQWFLGPFNASPPLLYRSTRRLMDITLSLCGLVLFGLLFPLIALAIYIDSPGPIFYSQERLGKGGKVFWVHKLRSMIPNAESKGQAIWASRSDPRITRVGGLLRRTRLDEMPQLLNVLRGEMSIIGPRPERPQFVDDLEKQIPFYRTRLNVKPGLTGWAQVKYRYGSTVEDALVKLQYDLYYIKHQSLMLDMMIILRTFTVMLAFKGT